MKENFLDTSELTNVGKVVYIEDHKREISGFLLSCKDASHFFQRSLSIAILVASKRDK